MGVGGVEGRMRGGVIGRGFAVRRERVDGVHALGIGIRRGWEVYHYRYGILLYIVCVKPS